MSAPVSETQIPQASKGIPSWVKLLAVAGIGLIILIVIGVVFVFNLTRGVLLASDTVIAHIRSANCAEIYTEHVTDRFRSDGTLEQWVEECERIGLVLTGDVRNEGVSVDGETGQAATATVNYAIDGSDAATYDVRIELERVDGVWKMDTFRSSAQ